jgi:hypothetical protein
MQPTGSPRRPGGIAREGRGLIFPAVMLSRCPLTKMPLRGKFRAPGGMRTRALTEGRPSMRRRCTFNVTGAPSSLTLASEGGTDRP